MLDIYSDRPIIKVCLLCTIFQYVLDQMPSSLESIHVFIMCNIIGRHS